VSDYFGERVSEKRIAKLCQPRLASGTTGANMVKAARRLGFSARIIDHARFKTIEQWLRRGVPVIVDWMSTEDMRRTKLRIAVGHYSVVCGLTGKSLILEDPAIGRRRTISRAVFLRLWFDFRHLYPKKRNDLIMRRLIVVAPKGAMSKRHP
jgi:ABC-type bacteriocin/lantibiotic exporter with double-glycine peptidase domain